MRIRPAILSTIIAIGTVASLTTSARSDGPNADVKALFAKTAAAYRNFKSVSFNIETVAAGSHQPETIKTRLTLVKPDRLAAEVTGKQGIIHVVADGKSVFTSSDHERTKYLKAPDTGYPAVMQALANSGGCGIGLITVLLTDPAAETKIVQGTAVFVRRLPDAVNGGDACDVVSAQTKNGNQVITYTFAFAKSDHFLRHVTVTDPSRPKAPLLTETYSAVKINPATSPALFRFEPPKGAVAINPNVPPPPYDSRIKIGAAPIPLTGADLSGKPVSLAQYKGKVLLLDFWATWCGPCVHELPNVIAAYGKYHAQGFDIVGITLDKQGDKQKVQEFVMKSQMPWRQIFDGKYWSSANATAYGVRAIPFALLIARDGKVAAISPRGPDLAPAIEAALKRR